MKLSVIIPVYNEKDTILEVIKRVAAVPIEKEIIVVDDGSTDGTRELLKQSHPPSPLGGEGRSEGDIKVILKEKNGGKGSAVREGLKYAKGDVVIIQDADLELNPSEYPVLLKPIIDNKADVVYGSRFLKKKKNIRFITLFANKVISITANVLFCSNLTDVETCYKVFPVKLMESITLKENGFGFEVEITAEILKSGLRITEVPVLYSPRSVEEGKKINWKSGFEALYILFRKRVYK